MNTLQKSILSAVTIVSFSFYTYVLHAQDTQIVAIASPLTLNTTPANGSAQPSSAAFQAYVDQINAAAKVQPQPVKSVDGQHGGSSDDGNKEGRIPTNTNAAQAAQLAAQQKAQAEALAQQQAAAQAQAQQQAAQLAAQEQAAAQAQARQPSGQYRDGTYDGPSVDVFYGFVQVQAIIQGGQLANVRFLSYPNDRRTSQYINSQAMPLLKQEAIQAQSAQVDGVSGASATSQGFVQSLGDALSQAHV